MLVQYRAIIVDDEAFPRTMMKTVVDWEALGVRLVGEAANGKEALEVIKRHQPDMIFLDLRMPGMDGLEVLRAVHGMSDVVAVVLSGYNDFDSVREAMKLGAVDYLHKPRMNVSEIEKAIDAMKSRLIDGELAGSTSRNITPPAGRPVGSESATHHGATHTGDRFDARSLFDRGLALTPPYYVLYLVIDRYCDVVKRYAREDRHFLRRGMETVLESLSRHGSSLEYLPVGHGDYLMFLSVPEMRPEEETVLLERVASRVRRGADRYLDVTVTIGMSHRHEDPADLHAAFQEAQTARRKRFFFGHDRLIRFCEQFRTEKLPDRALQTEIFTLNKNAKEHIHVAEFSSAKKYLQDLFALFSSDPTLGEEYIRQHAFDIHCSLTEKHLMLGRGDREEGELSSVSSEGLPLEHLTAVETVAELELVLLECLDTTAQRWADRGDGARKNPHVERAIAFIHAHYNDPELSLTIIAEELDINNSYLSRLFRQETGHTITEYLHQRRIAVAQETMRTSAQRQYQIARSVGYGSIAYFNVMFKKIVGMTPNEYRRCHTT